MNEQLRELVYAVVRLVPPGRVVSYGDIAELSGINPRLVGRLMSISEPADELPWWRVTNSYGDPPKRLLDEVVPRWADEGITLKPNGIGCRIKECRADLAALADDAECLLGPLSGLRDD